MRAEIEELRTAMKTIQAAKCSICHGQLDLPTGIPRLLLLPTVVAFSSRMVG